MQRSLLLLENCINSEETRKQYLYYLSRFISHYSLKDCDSIAVTKQDADHEELVVGITQIIRHSQQFLGENISKGGGEK